MPIAMIELVFAVFIHFLIVFKCFTLKDRDLHKETPIWTKWYVILSVSAVLAFMMHPGKNGYFDFRQQFFVSFSMFIEAFALIPQLLHMSKAKVIDGLNGIYLLFMTLSRLSRIGFWWSMSRKLSQFWYLIVSDTIHTIMAITFIISYKSLSKVTSVSSVLTFEQKPGKM